MLVERHQSAQTRGIQFINAYRGDGVEPARAFAGDERLGLGLGVGNQDAVQIGVPVAGTLAPEQIYRAVGRAFAQPLIKRVLRFVAVAAQMPDRCDRHLFAVKTHAFAETFHLKLLLPQDHVAKPLVVGKAAVQRNAKLH